MATYEFTVYMTGEGDTPEEAWEQSVEHVLCNTKDFAGTDSLPDYKELDPETFRERSNDHVGDAR